MRIGIVHNVDMQLITTRRATGHLCMACAIDVALSTLDVGVAKMFVTKLVKEENVEALQSGSKTWDDLAVSVRLSVAVFHKHSVKTITDTCSLCCYLVVVVTCSVFWRRIPKKFIMLTRFQKNCYLQVQTFLLFVGDTIRHDKGV